MTAQVTAWQEALGQVPAIQHQPPGAETESVQQCKDYIHCCQTSKYPGIDVCVHQQCSGRYYGYYAESPGF